MTSDRVETSLVAESLTIAVPVKRYRCEEVSGDMSSHVGALEEALEEVLVEYHLTIHVNGHRLIRLPCLPAYLEELAVGYLVTEGVVASWDEIDALRVDRETGRVDVQVKGKMGADKISTDRMDVAEAEAATEAATNTCEMILENANRLLVHSKLFRKTGNVHSVMLCRGKERLCFMEDMERFCAFDKCVGYAAMRGWMLKDTCMYTTGRMPSTLVIKAVRAGIPMLISRSAPTDKALELAARYGVTVVGFARGERMNIYNMGYR
ncbi:MAG: formate dehydrogenase accessory sulfurtransferase FdhD [Peptococcaceae bacterium]|nr:formate dehydrogenase accessory sulfurtransferase FdhD [Peptococcaceae bacterium]